MNEKIRELSLKAKRLPYEHNVSLESFAELIVKECADLINSMDGSSQYFPHVADAIEEHFGLK